MKKLLLTAVLILMVVAIAAAQRKTPTKDSIKTPLTKVAKKDTTIKLNSTTNNAAKKDTVTLAPIKLSAGPVPVDTTILPRVKQ